MKTQRVDLGELLKSNEKDFFRSTGFTKIKATKKIKQGKEESSEERYYEFEIRAVGSHPLLKEFNEKFPEPKAKIIREMLNHKTGESLKDSGIALSEIGSFPEFKWTNVHDQTDEVYLDEVKKRNEKLQMLWIMIAFSREEEYGIEKIDEFEKNLENLGLTSNQLNKIGADIKKLDFFTEEE